MKRVVFTKATSEPSDEKGTWWAVTANGKRSAIVVCPNCGRDGLGSLHRKHEIRANGDVHPSIVCTAPGCTFHEYGTLEDWKDESPP